MKETKEALEEEKGNIYIIHTITILKSKRNNFKNTVSGEHAY